MFFEHNLTAIASANLVGLMLLIVMLISNLWRFRYKTFENKMLIYMIIVAMVACVVIVISFVIDGKEGNLYRFLGYFTNSIVFLFNIITALLWALFVETHLKSEPNTKKKIILAIPAIIGFVMLLINFFVPVTFSLDADNWYKREPGYYVLLLVDAAYIVYVTAIYVALRVKGAILRFFPIYLFAAPIIVGLVLESMFYGISISWACIAIAVSGVLASLQNEIIYRDQLTGVYNRSYLNYLQKNFLDKDRYRMTGIMLNINNFKTINAKYGHAVGDKTLIEMAKLLKEAISDMGTVIRYAGDEFIVLIHSQKDAIVKTCIDEINNYIDKYNKNSELEFEITISLGYSKYIPEKQSMDDFMNNIDSEMNKNRNNKKIVEEVDIHEANN